MIDGKKGEDTPMTEIEKLRMGIGNLVWEVWNLLPEPKKSYTDYYQQVEMALDNYHLSDRERRIADREKGDVEI
jgi:hypothetical protein